MPSGEYLLNLRSTSRNLVFPPSAGEKYENGGGGSRDVLLTSW